MATDNSMGMNTFTACNNYKHDMKRYFLLMLLPLFTGHLTYAQSVPDKVGNLHISGRLVEGQDDSIRIVVEPYYLQNNSQQGEVFAAKLNDKGFTIRLKTPLHPYHISFYTYATGIKTSYFYTYGEPGDSIHIEIGKSWKITGRGSEKYSCFYEAQLFDYSTRIIAERLTPNMPESENVAIRNNFQDSVLKLRLAVLASYKSKLSVEMYDLLKTDLEYEVERKRVKDLRDNSLLPFVDKSINPTSFDLLMKAYPPLTTQEAYSNARFYSKFYLEFIYFRMLAHIQFKDRVFGKKYAFSLQDFIDYCNVYLPEPIREKVITHSFLWLIRFESAYALLPSRIERTKNPYFKTALTTLYKKNRRGISVFDFALPDSTGKIHRIADLKGKVVLIDFWFKGCAGCVGLTLNTAPMMERLKQYPNFVSITISIDQRQNWLAGLKGGKYTHSGGIDLYTNGLGKGHPLITHYAISSYPRLILVDKHGFVVDPNLTHDADKIEKAITDLL